MVIGRYWQKNKILLLAKCMKMSTFFEHLHFKLGSNCNITSKKYFLAKKHYEYQTKQNFALISNMYTKI